MKSLYDLRLKFNNGKNPAQVVIELLMNSIYGKLIIKPVEPDTTITDSRDDFEKCSSHNYNYIDNVLEASGLYYTKLLNQLCLILIMFTVGLKMYQCLNGL